MIFPKELCSVYDKGFNMSAFVPILYSIAREYRNGQKGIRTILEIGVRWGTSTLSFLYGLRDNGKKNPNIQLYSMDIKDCSGVCPSELKHLWTFMQGDSKTLPWTKEIDVLLIDGDHSLEGVSADYRRFEPFVKKGGLIIFHDVCWATKSPVKVFWDEVKYPKSVLSLSKSGLGIVYKVEAPYYDESLIKKDNMG